MAWKYEGYAYALLRIATLSHRLSGRDQMVPGQNEIR
jgi:hypothetical protein